MCGRLVHYPIRSVVPIENQDIKGFDIEFELADGTLAKAELRSDRPSWKKILPPKANGKFTIRFDTFNHYNLRDHIPSDSLIAEVHLPICPLLR